MLLLIEAAVLFTPTVVVSGSVDELWTSDALVVVVIFVAVVVVVVVDESLGMIELIQSM